MRKTRSTSNEHATRTRAWPGTASGLGLVFSLFVLASCGSSVGSVADAPAESEPAPAVERIVEPDSDCGPGPTSLSETIDADQTDCLYGAPVTLTADGPGELRLLIGPSSAGCALDVSNNDGSTKSPVSIDSTDTASAWVLDAGDGVTLSDTDDGACRFQVSWTPSAVASPTTTAAPTTTTTTTSTTTTTVAPTTTKKPTPPPTTTSAVGS